jgi:hypothetical protein
MRPEMSTAWAQVAKGDNEMDSTLRAPWRTCRDRVGGGRVRMRATRIAKGGYFVLLDDERFSLEVVDKANVAWPCVWGSHGR